MLQFTIPFHGSKKVSKASVILQSGGGAGAGENNTMLGADRRLKMLSFLLRDNKTLAGLLVGNEPPKTVSFSARTTDWGKNYLVAVPLHCRSEK